MLIADVSFMVAITDAIVEPLANAIWYFLLDKFWASKVMGQNKFIFFPNIILFNPPDII